MSWRKRPPASVQWEQVSDKYAACALVASAAYKEFAPVDPSFLFLDKRQELSGEENLYSENRMVKCRSGLTVVLIVSEDPDSWQQGRRLGSVGPGS